MPTINVATFGGLIDIVTSGSPYIFTSPAVGDTYTFNVSVTNIAGDAARAVSGLRGTYVILVCFNNGTIIVFNSFIVFCR